MAQPPEPAPEPLVIRDDVPLAKATSLEVGGAARHYLEITDPAMVPPALARAEAQGIPAWILGGGSNVVVPDEGLKGLVLHMATQGIDFTGHGRAVHVRAAAGEPWDAFVRATVERGLAGLECLSGIPGRVGATPIQNVGAYGQEVAETLVSVRVFDRVTKTIETIDRDGCRFGYRASRFKSEDAGRYVILDVTFALAPNGRPKVAYAELQSHLSDARLARPTLRDVRDAVLTIRRRKSMVLGDSSDENRRSCGSFFVNPVVPRAMADVVEARHGGKVMPRFEVGDGRIKLSAGWLIEAAGFRKGERFGNVGLSTRHALAIVCHDGATAREVAALAERIRERVKARFEVTLTTEPTFWSNPR
jgi:UDP-N-acetylmuramate dehydrogenase